MRLFLELFLEFFKTGLFAIGGGLATIPFLKAISETKKWFTQEELTNFIAISESTPGPIGINISTYAGFKSGEMSGNGLPYSILSSIIATFSLVLPAFLTVLFVAKYYDKFRTNKYIDAAFVGVRSSTAGLICGAMFSVFYALLWNEERWQLGISSEINGAAKWITNAVSSVNWIQLVAFAVFTFCIFKFKRIHPIVFILIGAVFGIAVGL